MDKYLYKGNFKTLEIEKQIYTLSNGHEYTLPSDNTKVRRLIASGKLTIIKEKTKTKGAK